MAKRGRRRQWVLLGAALLVAVVGYRVLRGDGGHITLLGPKVEVEVVDGFTSTGGKSSADGRTIAITKGKHEILVSREGGPWKPIKGLSDSLFVWVSFIANDGTVYGGGGDPRRAFRMAPDSAVEMDWPEIGSGPAFITGGSDDGRILTLLQFESQDLGLVLVDGKLIEIEPSDPSATIVIAKGASADGSIIHLSEQSPAGSQAFLLRDGRLDIASRVAAEIAGHSANGEWRIASGPSGLELINNGGVEQIWKAPSTSPTLSQDIAAWLESLAGHSPVASITNAISVTPRFVSNDGRLVIATSFSKSTYNNRRMVAWQRGVGWRELAEEVTRRGGRIPDGWMFAAVTGVSSDGQTIVGTIEKGPDSRAVVIRFSGGK